MTTRRPVITIDPAVSWGRPAINGVSTEAIAGAVAGGETLDTVASDYGITVPDVLVACWWEGTAGVYRRQWGGWADQAYRVLAGWDKDTELPDPPSVQAD